ncbi:MAG: iron-containing alcohol dehydrogenase [Bacteroidetes bacterium]|nr:iron-containing alcohol dehydrogenase [Bacteroidota bacterium]
MHNFKSVERCVYGRGAFNDLEGILQKRRVQPDDFIVFFLDDCHKGKPLESRVPVKPGDLVLVENVDVEPKTEQIDAYVARIKAHTGKLPVAVVGIGGGSIMDIAKATSLMLTNPGKSEQYQGLDLIKIPGVYHVGVPTISGTGAEVSRTAVLTGPVKKLGLKCDYTYFDQIVLDPELVVGVPRNQWFYTGMDCYIHCVESLQGTHFNTFSEAYGSKALELCRDVYLDDTLSQEERDDKLMVASYMGGLSLTYSEVGVCHGLSYGLSYVFGTRHGIANCIVFNQLEEYYPAGVREFWQMVEKHGIHIPAHLSRDWTEEQIAQMADVAIRLEHFWVHHFGPQWRQVWDVEKIKDLYRRM